jgi:hypothetical protein
LGLPTDDTVELATLPLGFPHPGCSVAWLPADRTTTAAPLLSRAFDFTTLTFNQFIGVPPQPGDEPFAGRAYILEPRPPSGHGLVRHRVVWLNGRGRVRQPARPTGDRDG